MTQSRSVTYTNTLSNQVQTITFPDYSSAYRFVLGLHIAGVSAVINLLPEDVRPMKDYGSLIN
jgi:hypothetical protein